MKNPVLIFGAGPLGRSVREIFDANEVVVYGFLDDRSQMHQSVIDEVTVLGSTDDEGFLKLIGRKCEACIAVEETKVRKHLVQMLNDVRKVQPVNAIHPTASLPKSAAIGHGNIIDAGVRAGVGSEIGSHTICNAGSYLGVGTRVGNFVQIGAGAILNSGVVVEDEVFIGTGAVIVSGVTLGKGCSVGAGSVVIGPVKAGETVFGNPAQAVKR